MCALRAATADGRLRRSACGAQNLSVGARRVEVGEGEEEDKIQEEPGQLCVATTHLTHHQLNCTLVTAHYQIRSC